LWRVTIAKLVPFVSELVQLDPHGSQEILEIVLGLPLFNQLSTGVFESGL
jgi:hypothetical protein